MKISKITTPWAYSMSSIVAYELEPEATITLVTIDGKRIERLLHDVAREPQRVLMERDPGPFVRFSGNIAVYG